MGGGQIYALSGVGRTLDAEFLGVSIEDAAALADVDGDGLSDLLRPVSGGAFAGLFGLAGARDGELRPLLAIQSFEDLGPGAPLGPSVKLAAVARNDDPALRLVYALVPGASLSVVRVTPILGPPSPIVEAEVGEPEALAAPAVGDLGLDAGDELVVGYRGTASVVVLDVAFDGATAAAVALDAPLAGDPVLGDVDDDGDLDLLLPVSPSPGTTGVDVALNAGGVFGDASLDARFSSPAVGCDDGTAAAVGGAPLRAGDLDGDGLTDYVTADGVVLAAGPGSFCLAARLGLAQPVEGPVFLDANGDGLGDVAWLGDAETVKVAVGKPGGAWISRQIAVSGLPIALRAGTFGWDSLDDLLVVEGTPGGEARVELILGRVDDAADALVRGPTLPTFADVAVGPLTQRLEEASPDGLVIAGTDPTGGPGGYLARILTTTDHRLISALRAGTGTVAALFAGDFDGQDRPDILAIVQGASDSDLWIWRDQGPYLIDRVPDPARSLGPGQAGRPTATADVDGDGAEELVTSSDAAISVYTLGDPVTSAAFAVDEAPALLGRLSRPGGDCVVAGSTEGVTAYCAFASGEPGAAIPVTPAAAIAVTQANVDADGETELVVVTAAGAELFDVDVLAGAAMAIATLPLLGEPAGRGAAADLDGDGVADLVIGLGGTVQVLWGVPHDAETP